MIDLVGINVNMLKIFNVKTLTLAPPTALTVCFIESRSAAILFVSISSTIFFNLMQLQAG